MKIVFGNIYFATESLNEVPHQIRKLYEKALMLLPFTFRHNIVKIARDKKSVTLLYYPHLETYAHPYLLESVLVQLNRAKSHIKRRRENMNNPVILHRLETFLSSKNPRISYLKQLTKKEETLGLYAKKHLHFIGRRKYWNNLCKKVGLLEAMAPESLVSTGEYSQLQLLSRQESNKLVFIKREATAINRSKPSLPTCWALKKGHVKPTVLDWGCGKGKDVKWLKSKGIKTIGYDPYYKPEPKPAFLNFNQIQTILLNYVLNVIENPLEREALLKTIKNLAGPSTLVIIAVRSNLEIIRQAKIKGWHKYADGYITTRNTFQKGFTLAELRGIGSILGRLVDSLEFSGGIVGVFSVGK